MFKGWQRKKSRNVIERNGKVNIKPINSKPAFKGKIYILVGTQTWSSGTWFAVAFKDNELGQIIGQNCASNSFRYGHTYNIGFEDIGFSLISSFKIWKRAFPGAKNEKFIRPHNYIHYSLDDIRNQNDPVFNYVISKI